MFKEKMKPYVVSGLLVLFSCLFCLAAAIAGGKDPYYHFDEFRIATYYNAVQILFCAVIGAAIFLVRRKQKAGKHVWFWLIVAVGSIYLSLDEMFSFHDHKGAIISTIQKFVKVEIPYNAIVTDMFYLSYSDFILIAYGLLAILFSFCFRQELMRCLHSKWFFLLGTLFLIASVTIDFNLLMKAHHSLDLRGYNQPVLHAFEESFKVVGFTCFFAGLVNHYLTIRDA
jgi:hypothetical protein